MKLASRTLLISVCISLLPFIGFAQSGIIKTYAGSQSSDSIPIIRGEKSVVADGSGGVYVASTFNNSVYRISADGQFSTVAGNGISGFSGDGGVAIKA